MFKAIKKWFSQDTSTVSSASETAMFNDLGIGYCFRLYMAGYHLHDIRLSKANIEKFDDKCADAAFIEGFEQCLVWLDAKNRQIEEDNIGGEIGNTLDKLKTLIKVELQRNK